MAKVSTTNVDVLQIRNVLGYPSTDVGTLCSCVNVNMWSKYKPLNSPTVPRTSEILNRNYGFIWSGSPLVFSYDKPKGGVNSPYVLNDFSGYNHDAKAVQAFMQDITFVGAPPDANIFIGPTATSAEYYVDIQLPEFSMVDMGFGNFRYIRISNGKYGTSNFIETVGTYTIQPDDIDKKIRINCVETKNLPIGGYTATHEYYVTFGGAYFIDVNFNKIIGVLYRQFTPDINDPNQWRDVTVEDPGGLIEQGGFKYDSWIYFYSDGKRENTVVRITNLYVGMGGQPLKVYYNYNNTWYFHASYKGINSYIEFTLVGKPNVSTFKVVEEDI